MTSIDLNSDLGESFGTWSKGHDQEILKIVTSANIACGFHAGDPLEMLKTCRLCNDNDVGIGAHPGFRDLIGFGRREIPRYGDEQLEAESIFQIGALQAIAGSTGSKVRHVKFHGALANMASRDRKLARLLIETVLAIDEDIIMLVIAGTEQERAAEELGAKCAREIFADRAYNDDGTLVTRNVPGAMIRDPKLSASNMLRAVETGKLISINGSPVNISPESICVHGDTPEAVAIATEVRMALENSGVSVSRFM